MEEGAERQEVVFLLVALLAMVMYGARMFPGMLRRGLDSLLLPLIVFAEVIGQVGDDSQRIEVLCSGAASSGCQEEGNDESCALFHTAGMS